MPDTAIAHHHAIPSNNTKQVAIHVCMAWNVIRNGPANDVYVRLKDEQHTVARP